ncbi:MAG: dienelactone hydrolase family protein [Acetobacteraceae bacterium]|nr:dienelactone hydrolase family protein [Acetobacteraceae bacterium]
MAHRLSRRIALGGCAAFALAGPAHGQSDGVEVGETQILTDGGPVPGVFAKPVGPGPFPIVLVAENGAGLDRVVTDTCHGLAKEGFFAVAPALFRDDPPDGTIMRRLDGAGTWAMQHGGDLSHLGIVGFGPGGRVAWLYDAYSPVVKAAVVWYGPVQGAATPARPITVLEAARHLNAPLLGLYGQGSNIPKSALLDLEAQAKRAGKTVNIVTFVGAGPNFAAPGSAGYDPAATVDGWKRAIKWLREH